MAYVEKLPSGKFRGVYRDPYGRRHTQTFRLKSDAQDWAREQEKVAQRGGHNPDAPRQRFDDYVAEWFEHARDLRPSTRKHYAFVINTRLLPVFGRRPIGSIRRDDVRAWIASMTLEGLAPDTIDNYFRVLRVIMRAAHADGRIATIPTYGVKRPKATSEEMRFLSHEEIARLADAIDPRYSLLIKVLAYGGLRIGEAAGLTPDKIDTARRRVVIDQQLVESGPVHLGTPKSRAGIRSVPLPTDVFDELVKHVENLPPGAEYVFTSPEGGPLRRHGWRSRFWVPAVWKSGLVPPRLRTHDLRHTAVSHWIAAGADAKTVAYYAGHSSVSITFDRYGHLMPGHDDRVVAALDAAIAASTARPGAEAQTPAEPPQEANQGE